MNRKKLIGIVAACIIVAIVVVVVATRPKPAYTLDVSVSPPGAGSVSPSGGEHESGAQITLTASPASDYVFASWTGDVDAVADVFAATTTVTMNGDYSIMANFEEWVLTFPGPDVGAAIRGAINEKGYINPADLQNHGFRLTE